MMPGVSVTTAEDGGGAANAPTKPSAWLKSGIVALLIGLIYASVLKDLALDWWNEERLSYGFLIPPLALYVAWMRRRLTFAETATPNSRGLWLIGAACLLFLLGKVGAEFFISRMSFVLLLAGLTWTFWGSERLRSLAFPFLLLATMVPLPVIVYNAMAAPLQLLASDMATNLAQALGVTVYRDGNVIHLARISLGVEEACSGLNSLSALMVGGLLLGERRHLLVAGGRAPGAPTVSGATPAHLVGRQLVAATSGVRGETRCDDDGVVESAAQERGGKGGAEIVVGVAAGAVDDDECARDLGIRAVQRVGAVDEGAGGSAGERHPFGTVGHGGAWRGPSGGGHETNGKQLHWRLGYNVSRAGSLLMAFIFLSPRLGTLSNLREVLRMTMWRVWCLAAVSAAALCAGDKVVGGPYVVNATARGATVAWIVESDTVKFQAAGAAAKTSPALKVEYSNLSGLQPNTRYDYEVAGGKGWFKTPPSGAGPFRFVLYGDVRTRHDVHRRVMAALLKNGVPDLVLHSGDLVENGKDSSLWATFFDIERDLLRQTSFFPSLGNHERNAQEFYDFFQTRLPYYSFNWGNAHFTVIDTDIANVSPSKIARDAFWEQQTGWRCPCRSR